MGVPVEGELAADDAFFRRYFRYQWQTRSLIAMDAPPQHSHCGAFIRIAQLLAAHRIRVPEIIATDLKQGFLLLSDLGQYTLLESIDDRNADTLLTGAIDTLIALQQIPVSSDLPTYDHYLLRQEFDLFPVWYLQKHLNITLNQAQQELLESLFEQLIAAITQQTYCFVHRDYMLRNLMTGDVPGVLDFQDAVCGPISYDIISLLKDAFISWPEAQVEQKLHEYWQKARSAHLPVPDSYACFQEQCDFMSVQRHLKVIGIFARLHYRDHKPRYLPDVPRFFRYLQTVAQRRPQLTALATLLAQIASQQEGQR